MDLILATGLAYRKVWEERAYLFTMAVIPLLIKYICYTLATIFIEGDNILRMSLFMLPAYLVEGWLLSHWARTIMLGHRWPFRSTGDVQEDEKQLNERAHGVLGGTVAYMLINILMGGYFAFFVSYIPVDMNPSEADPIVALAGLAMMVSSFLLFRFIWSYVPLAANISPRYFIEKVKPLRVTFQMMGIWLVCFVPVLIVLQISGEIIGSFAIGGQNNSILSGILNFIRIALDTLKNLICTAGIAYGLMQLFKMK